MTPDNALLVRTGARAPSEVAKQIERLFGDSGLGQLVDKADPDRAPAGRHADRGRHGHGRRRGGRLPLHRPRRRPHRAGPGVGARAHHHRGGADPRLGDLQQADLPAAQGGAPGDHRAGPGRQDPPEQYAGCYYPRFIAGTTTLSNHAFGLALDINAVENQRGTVGLIDRGVVAIFQKWGFTWGGDWRYTDPMHFELNSIRTPAPESARN